VASIADSIIINDLNISEFEIEGAIRMELQDTIFTHFPIQLQRIFGSEKKINVIVYPPAERMPE
ncbi:4782_t:CDS:1, partial [Rhizophagus irregularis]